MLFFWIGMFLSYLWRFLRNLRYFPGSKIFCIIRLRPSNEEYTIPNNISSMYEVHDIAYI